jgi:predicted nicotinamide N-methyase
MLNSNLRVRYQTIEVGSNDLHLCTLRDRQQFSDPGDIAKNLGISDSTWPIFGLVWPSSIVLCNHMLNFNISGKRILEVGCGIALSSLLLNKLNANITATDYHPEVKGFLERNTLLNNGKPIKYERVDWADDRSDLGLFDVIIGSDLLYEDQHIEQLANFIENHANTKCEVIIVDPGRGRKTKLSKKMVEFGFSCEQTQPIHTDFMQEKFKGYILTFLRTKA